MTARRGYFITGTDTGVGKTFVACGILRAAAAAGLSTSAVKPLAAGALETPTGPRNEDALALQAAMTLPLAYDEINPVCLPEAIAPHIAARHAGRRIKVERLAGFCRGVMMHGADLCLVEGAGGWRVPVNDREMLSDLARTLGLPVVLVVGMRLGCLNHALLTAEAILADKLSLAGWVANRLEESMPAYEENLQSLRALLPAPMLAEVAWRPGAGADCATDIDIRAFMPAASGKR